MSWLPPCEKTPDDFPVGLHSEPLLIMQPSEKCHSGSPVFVPGKNGIKGAIDWASWGVVSQGRGNVSFNSGKIMLIFAFHGSCRSESTGLVHGLEFVPIAFIAKD